MILPLGVEQVTEMRACLARTVRAARSGESNPDHDFSDACDVDLFAPFVPDTDTTIGVGTF